MQYKKLVSPSLTDLFIQEMRKSIFNGSLKPGERLASERQLADSFGVSLSVVHNGVSRLCNMGLLKSESRKGITVTDYVREGNIQTMYEILDFTGGKMEKEVIRPIIECRRGIEITSKEEAARNRSDEDIDRISMVLEDIKNSKNLEEYANAFFAFHHESSMASKNIYYPMLIRTFHPLYIAYVRQYVTEDFMKQEVEIFREILDAIIKKDSVRAGHAAEEDIHIWEILMQL